MNATVGALRVQDSVDISTKPDVPMEVSFPRRFAMGLKDIAKEMASITAVTTAGIAVAAAGLGIFGGTDALATAGSVISQMATEHTQSAASSAVHIANAVSEFGSKSILSANIPMEPSSNGNEASKGSSGLFSGLNNFRKNAMGEVSSLAYRGVEAIKSASPAEQAMMGVAALAAAPVVVPIAAVATVGAVALSVSDAAITSASNMSREVKHFVGDQIAQTKANFIEAKDLASIELHKIGEAMPSITQKQVLTGVAVAATAMVAAPIAIPLAGVAAAGAASYGIVKASSGQTDDIKQDVNAVSEKIKSFYKPVVGLLEKLSEPAPEKTAKLKLG